MLRTVSVSVSVSVSASLSAVVYTLHLTPYTLEVTVDPYIAFTHFLSLYFLISKIVYFCEINLDKHGGLVKAAFLTL